MAISGPAVITYGLREVDSDTDQWAARLVSDRYLDTLPAHSEATVLEKVLGWIKIRALKRLRRNK